MNKLLATLGGAVIATVWASSSYAIPMDAPESYGEASHSTTQWQELATAYDADDYGISWSLDGGSSWGQTLDLYVGQTVQFKLNLQENKAGTHYANLAKAWVDWGQNGTFESDETVAYGLHVIRETKNGNMLITDADHKNIEYTSAEYTLTDDHVGDLWLRALATCSESTVANYYNSQGVAYDQTAWWNAQWSPDFINNYEERLVSTGHYGQGETEEFKLTVHAVPEPSTVLLLGLGIAGMVARRRVALK